MLLLLSSLALAKPSECIREEDVAALRARIADLEAQLTVAVARAEAAELVNTTRAEAPVDRVATDDEEAMARAIYDDAQAALRQGDVDGAKARLEELAAKFPTTRVGRSSQRLRTELALIGSSAPPIVVDHWFQGEVTYGGAPVTLLVFFEQWCPHCKREIPRLQEEQAALRARGIQTAAFTKVTKSATDEKVVEFLTENGVTFPVAKETGQLSTDYAVSGIPAAALVRDGVVIWRGHPARIDTALLDSLLGAK